ncbi:MAG TPA: ABC-F family ATP-binding cassette domain-containing protein [Jiangellales bacterium]|nr:ABC-F family ATP-binding cassette domain-containing protein [Jiangellales bacterium]
MPPAPVNLVNLEATSLAYGTRTLLDAVSLGVAVGDRVGVVGRNGGGKTTLLRVLARREAPDSGRVTHTGDLRIGWLGQQDDLDPTATVHDVVLGDRPEHDWAGDPLVREVLAALLPAVPRDATVGPLSGGERRRVALARLLVARDDLLLLDEPTNHLDVEAIDWVARHLAARASALVVVTHDRWFLDAVATSTWEVQGGRVHMYEGGYSAYVLARAERARIAAADEARRQNLLRKELAWLRRGPPARTSKPRFRIDAANALIADEPPPRDRLELERFASARLGRSVYELEAVSISRGGRTLLRDVDQHLGPGDRVGLVGLNGAGKTTLLRLLAGEVLPDTGTVSTGRTVRVAYLTQEVAGPESGARVLDSVERVRRVVDLGKGREVTASSLLERFGFAGERQWTRLEDLSGGERRRLQLLRLLMGEPNVLLLDEPTNDLDIETLTVLEDLLDSWPGSLVAVSHDRYFLERVTDVTWALLGDGRLALLPGGVDEYLARRRAGVGGAGSAPRGGAVAGSAPRGRAVAGPGPAGGEPLAGGAAVAGAGPAGRRGDTRAARKELARLEREVDKLTRREERLHADLAANATDHERVLTLDAELRDLRAERDRLEERWLELAEQPDA